MSVLIKLCDDLNPNPDLVTRCVLDPGHTGWHRNDNGELWEKIEKVTLKLYKEAHEAHQRIVYHSAKHASEFDAEYLFYDNMIIESFLNACDPRRKNDATS